MVQKLLLVPQLMMWKGCHCLACHATCTVYRDRAGTHCCTWLGACICGVFLGIHIHVPQVLSSVCMFVYACVCVCVFVCVIEAERG